MGLAESKSILGLIHLLQADLKHALSLTEEGLDMAGKVGFPGTMADTLAARNLVTSIEGSSAN